MEIPRYNLAGTIENSHEEYLDEEGDWCKWDDAQSYIKKLEQTITSMAAELQRFSDEFMSNLEWRTRVLPILELKAASFDRIAAIQSAQSVQTIPAQRKVSLSSADGS